eukprot:GHVL01025319.1.p1 GENE.GHVL01025319.1~~GHVL01025319.1.p1  ORF type:complete len:232 (+),score=40.51 GHVL01025319.1:140-835(+)
MNNDGRTSSNDSSNSGSNNQNNEWKYYLKWTPALLLFVSINMFILTFWYYTNMIRLTRDLQEANTFSSIHSEYASEETLSAIEILEDFVEGHPNDYPSQFFKLRLSHIAAERVSGRRLDRARRKLVHFYTRILYLFQLGYLRSPVLYDFPGGDRARYFIRTVEPIEKCMRMWTGRNANKVFDFFREFYKINEWPSFPCDPSPIILPNRTDDGQCAMPVFPFSKEFPPMIEL